MEKITPCLWFDNQGEEAARFYTSIFKNSKIGDIAYYTEDAAKMSGRPVGSVMTVNFTLDGQDFMALNGGPMFKFNEAVSMIVNCDDQREVDEMWSKLTAGGEESVCGWLKDKFGLSWQVVPKILGELMKTGDSTANARLMKAILQMKKLDVETLKRAYEEPVEVAV